MRVVSKGWWYGSSKTLGYLIGILTLKEKNNSSYELKHLKSLGGSRSHILKTLNLNK